MEKCTFFTWTRIGYECWPQNSNEWTAQNADAVSGPAVCPGMIDFYLSTLDFQFGFDPSLP